MFMRYKTAAVHTTPLELLGDKVPAWRGLGTVARLHGTLEKHDVQLVLVVDELDTVFLGSDPNDKEIIAQLLQIAELDVPRRRIVVIVTGSSACLRRLCFQAATDSDRSLYRAYVGKSFNDRKYVAFTVGLLQDATEVAAAMRSLQAPLPAGGSDSGVAEAEDDDAESVAEDGVTNEAATRLLLRTRGVMQCVADALAGRQDVQQRQLLSFANKRGNKRLQSIWSVLMRYLQAEHNVALIHALQTSAIMDLPEVALSDLQALDPTLTREVLYEWADNGFISFGPRPAALAAAHDSSQYVVSFAHVSDLLWAAANVLALERVRVAHATPRVHALAAAESACLVNPAGTDLHEQLLAEAIAAKFTLTPATAAKYITDGYVLCRDLQFTYFYSRCTIQALMAERSRWTGELFKLDPDNGVDLGAVHVLSEVPLHLLVLNVQCKMTQCDNTYLTTKSNPKKANVADVDAGLERVCAEIRLCSAAEQRITVVKFLATVLRVSDATKVELRRSHIHLIGRDDLAQMWPGPVAAFLRGHAKLRFMASPV